MQSTFFQQALDKDELLSEEFVISQEISDNAVDEKNKETFGVDGKTLLFYKLLAKYTLNISG